VHEIKHDGFRVRVNKRGDRVRLFTRRGYDWSERYPQIVEAAKRLNGWFVIDGEAVVADEYGIANFERLHSRQHDKSATGVRSARAQWRGPSPTTSLRAQVKVSEIAASLTPLRNRPERTPCLRRTVVQGRSSRALGFEGVVSKRRDSRYGLRPQQDLGEGQEPEGPWLLRFWDRKS
jgi:bifunctional non-homologous end joining protein LigD